jgi:hydrogenase expression/formation protein HypE
MSDNVTLSEGSGGEEMNSLISIFKGILSSSDSWKGSDDDAAYFDLGDGRCLVFTTDSYIVDPIFFPGGDIGHIAASGTINDISVMGAKPLGISLGIIIEEGFPKDDLKKIIESIEHVCSDVGITVVTGDTKVMEKGKIDKIVINTAGIGIAKKEDLLIAENNALNIGDKIIVSGSIGEHAVALLSKRFDFKTKIVSDSQPLYKQIFSVHNNIKIAKDPTRGGISAALHEIIEKHNCGILLSESEIPIKKEVHTVSDMLGLDPYMLACEGRFICVCSDAEAEHVISSLKEFDSTAAIIGLISEGDKLVLQTELGQRIIPKPIGRIVPRIC